MTWFSQLFLLFCIFLPIINCMDYNLYSCSGEIKQDSASSNARLGDSSWIQDSYCIEPHAGEHKWIKLRIHYLQLPMSDDCIDEKLVIFSDRVIQRPSSVSYCGNMTNVELILPSTRAVIRFEARITEGGYHLKKEKREFHLSYYCFTQAEKQSSKPPAPLHCCQPNEYACNPRFYVTLQETTCLPLNKVCDGIAQCPYGDDEWRRNCPKPSSTTPPAPPTPFPIPPDSILSTEIPPELIGGGSSIISTPPEALLYTCAHQINATIINKNRELTRIAPSQLCDGKVDCPMADDEMCFRGCASDQFKCVGSSRVCISKKFLCDNQLDCADALDESCDYRGKGDLLQLTTGSISTVGVSSTGTTPTPTILGSSTSMETTIEANTIQTTSSSFSSTSRVTPFSVTTPSQLVCNRNYFLCKEARRCIPMLWVCDNYPDCSSAEDEDPTMCAARRLRSSTVSPPTTSVTTPPRTTPATPPVTVNNNARRELTLTVACSENEYVCSRTGSCLAMERVCDGNVDCRHGEDENILLCSRGQHQVTVTKQQEAFTLSSQSQNLLQTLSSFSSSTPFSTTTTTPTTTSKSTDNSIQTNTNNLSSGASASSFQSHSTTNNNEIHSTTTQSTGDSTITDNHHSTLASSSAALTSTQQQNFIQNNSTTTKKTT